MTILSHYQDNMELKEFQYVLVQFKVHIIHGSYHSFDGYELSGYIYY